MSEHNPDARQSPRARRKISLQAALVTFLVVLFVGGLFLLTYSAGDEQETTEVEDQEPRRGEPRVPGAPSP